MLVALALDETVYKKYALEAPETPPGVVVKVVIEATIASNLEESSEPSQE